MPIDGAAGCGLLLPEFLFQNAKPSVLLAEAPISSTADVKERFIVNNACLMSG